MKDLQKAEEYLNRLCSIQPNRRTGSSGNRKATDFFATKMKNWDYTIDTTPFPCLDYETGKTSLVSQGGNYEVYISPFSLGCDVTSELVAISTVTELENCRCEDKILLMRGDICKEQLMPKNFVFYNPDHHKRIYALLEEKQPVAIITATEKNPELVGALYPFPLIEDGDFDIPSVYCTDFVGKEILTRTGELFQLTIEARRIPATACNVIAKKNQIAPQKILVSAHIDAYWSTPGALDDASGTTVLLLIADLLQDYRGKLGIELVAFNGEDYYSAGGEMDYLHRYEQEFAKIVTAINIDDVGYKQGKTVYSLYECSGEIQQKAQNIFGDYDGIVVGEPWYQGDHMIFVQKGIPAIAFTSENMAELMATVVHTSRDTFDMIDCEKIVEVARALGDFIESY